MDTDYHLARVLTRQDQEREAKDRFRQALRDAVEAGVPQTQIVKVTGISRVTLWRWLKEGE